MLKFKYNKPNLDQYYPKEDDLRMITSEPDFNNNATPLPQDGQGDAPKVEGQVEPEPEVNPIP